MLKIGQLAKHAGLTVRTLHHYDDIGLLRPSVRTDAGYRLYGRDDVARLHQIQALRQLGMPLADIGSFLAHSGTPALAIVERQLAALDRQIDEAARMRTQLQHLHARLSRGEQPELAEWLTTLEQMKMYDKYFSKEELNELAFYHDEKARAEWQELVAHVALLMERGIQPASAEAKEAGKRWLDMLKRDTAGNSNLIVKLDLMHEQEPALRQTSGITPELKTFIGEVIGEIKYDAYAAHLLPAEMEKMRQHHRTRGKEWFPLFAAIAKQMRDDPDGIAEESRRLAKLKQELFEDMVGNHPDTVARFRAALANEPVLYVGQEMVEWLRRVAGQR